ncbi:MAG: CarD family transcriptional regulator [Candidatus Saccharibacteria bacterium]|jgi:CRP/FNR family cyclic AMP-dependent transcriptional regulator|nr:CarD family transcriptional regulator [Candidatus Saccharibacteria bacterium]
MLATLKQTAELVELFKVHGLKQTFRKGDFIIRPGDSPQGVFYIGEGLVKAYDITKYNEENLLIIRKHEEIFPLIWGLTGQERQVIYQTLAPTTTWQISREKFLEFIESKPDALAPLLDMTMEMYRLHSERILNLEYRTVRERIISFLLTMSERFGKPVDDGLLIEVPLRHQDIASSVNATRETTSRELSALERKGLLTNKQSLIVLRDLPGLRKHLD